DGIYIGATATRGMLISMAVATLTFFLLYAALHTIWGNHALWLSFLAYLTQRGLVQTLLRKQVYHKIT
ncbi:MAG: MATE family efflux transporter, partial [Bacteroides sp.]